MGMKLVIVESPTKAKTLSKFLGKDYVVYASMGHIRDLPKKELGVDVEKDFEPKYINAPKASKVIRELKSKAKEATEVFLATDPDREGEAIAWHVLHIISEKGVKLNVKRVVFHEITKDAVDEAFAHVRELDVNLVDSQQARRVLDRLVGYKLSPLLWKKVRYGLSAGRVQSVAVRLVVDREDERKNFKPEEFWSLDALLEQDKAQFLGSLVKIAGKKAEIANQSESDALLSDIKDNFLVDSVEKSDKKRYPYPPFTTSTLQQAGSNRLGFAAKRTMSVAQKLFEAGFITYHRTDSFFLSQTFLEASRGFIKGAFGEQYLPEKPNYYKNRSKNAQEAHEAIRPTHANVTVKDLSEFGSDEKKIYSLIWQRAISSQMLPAIYEQTVVLMNSNEGKYTWKAGGSTVKFDGWQKVYEKVTKEETEEEEKADDEEKLAKIPDLAQGDKPALIELKPEQHFTQPPPRYNEASLIKALEEMGIGRPSTYAPIISTIQERGYVVKENKYFYPQDVGVVVTKLLTEHFSDVLDYGFTAHIEEEFDKIANGEIKWVPVIREFYDPFVKDVESSDSKLNKKDMTLLEETEEICPDCGKHLNIKLGKYGRFKSCSGFPDCKFAQPIVGNGNGNGSGEVLDETQLGKCPQCETGVLSVREGRFGKFVACSTYPKCKFTKPYLEKIGMKCPTCNEGEVIVKKGGKFKKTFYGCSRYPDCKYISNKNPLKNEPSVQE